MKKLIAMAFVGAFALAMVACGGGAKEESKEAESTTAPAAQDTTKTDTTKTDTTAVH